MTLKPGRIRPLKENNYGRSPQCTRHVILRSHKGEEFPSDNAVLEAASLAVFFSKSIMVEEHSEGAGSRAGEIKAEVDYCPVSHVKKIPGARPGMVIYESYYSVLVPAKEPS